MKKMKKIFALLLAMVMVLGMATVVFAQTEHVTDSTDNKGKIVIGNASNGMTYGVIKLFDATVNADGSSIAYTGTIPEALSDYFKKDAAGNITSTDAAWNAEKTDMSSGLRDALQAWAETQTPIKSVASNGDKTLTFDQMEYGYYVVTTTQGETLITVDSTNPVANVIDKNTTPPISNPKKYAGEDEAAEAEDTDNNVFIGQQVNYTIEFGTSSYDDKGDGTDIITSYVISDDFANGVLTDVTVTEITIGGTAYTTGDPAATPQFDADGKITIPWVTGTGTTADPYKSKYANGAKIVIKYTATVAATAAIDGAGNTNTATIGYTTDKNPEPTEVPVQDTVYTYAIAIKKINDKNEPLAGAKFQFPFYVQATPANDGAYIYAGTEAGEGLVNELETPANGVIIVKGVANGTYSITETEPPKGYNKLGGPVSVTAVKTGQTTTNKTIYLDENGNVVAESAENVEYTVNVTIDELAATPVVVLNKSGAELPSTGGMGTTIFYIVGAILVLGAGVVLVTRRRMNVQ